MRFSTAHVLSLPNMGTTTETICNVILGLKKTRPLGREQEYALVITNKRLIFALQRSKGVLNIFSRRLNVIKDPQRFLYMSPDEILRESVINYDILIDEVSFIEVIEDIPFTLMYDPSDALKNYMVDGDDDVVVEMPNILRHDTKVHQEEVERSWTLTIVTRRATLSFSLDYSPESTLIKCFKEKMM